MNSSSCGRITSSRITSIGDDKVLYDGAGHITWVGDHKVVYDMLDEHLVMNTLCGLATAKSCMTCMVHASYGSATTRSGMTRLGV